MAVAIESFSIREYAEKTRKIDMGKCWPFAWEGREVKGLLLPPITLRKFRWWVDELGSERVSDESANVSFAEDGCDGPVRAGGRGKQKVPKKRSIVELFAVAPQIKMVEEDENGEDEEDDDLGDGKGGEVLERGEAVDGEVKERTSKGHAVIRRKQLVRLQRLNKQKKRNKIIASKKAKSHASKFPSAGLVSPLSENCSRKTKLKEHLGEHTKKKRAQASKTRQNCKSIRVPKFSSKKYDDCRKASLRSILKNRIISNKRKVLASRLRCHHMNSCGELIKHVSFSDKDDFLGPNKNSAPKELPKLQTLCKVLFSDVLASSAGIKISSKNEKNLAEKENMGVSVSSIRLADRLESEKNRSINANGLTIRATDPNSSNCPDKVKNKTENFDLNKDFQMDSNLNFPISSDSTFLRCHQDSSNRQILDFIYNEDLSSHIRSHVQNNASSTSAVSSNSFNCRISVPISNSTNSLKLSRNSVMQPSRPCMISTMQNDIESLQRSTVQNITESKSAYFSSKYLSDNGSSVGSMKFMELMAESDPMIFTREKFTNECFIGLPLNSKGELVKLDSSCKFGFNNPFKKNNTVIGSFHGSLVPSHTETMTKIAQELMKESFHSESLYAKDMLHVLPKQYCSSENQLASGELKNFEGMETEKFEPVLSKYSYRVSCNACNLQNCICQADRLTYHPGMNCGCNVAPQPTMRLMGTTVTIGEISKESRGFHDSKVWTDKTTTTEQCSGASVHQCLEQETFATPAPWPSQEKHILSSHDQQSLHYIPLVGLKLDCQQSPKPALHCLPSQASVHLTQQPLIHCNSVKPKPVAISVSRDISHQWLLNSTNCKHTQSFSSNKSSASNASFRNSTPGCFAEPSSVLSSPYHSQRQINSREPLNGQIIPFFSYPTSYSGNHPCTIPGTNFLSHLSPCSESLIALPVYNIQTPNTCSSSTSASLGPHSFVPGYSVKPSISANNSLQVSCAQNTAGPKSNYTCLSPWNPSPKTKKRIAEKGHEFIRPSKKANVIFPIKSCSIRRPVGKGQQNMLHLGNEARNPSAQFLGYKNDEYKCFFESSSEYHRGISGHVSRAEKNFLKPSENTNPSISNLIYSSGAGPVKLKAGAKHILKPCRNSDLESSRLIHSAIPLVDGNFSGGFVVSHKKLEEIYSF